MDELTRNALGRYADALAGVADVVREEMLTGIESLTTARPGLAEVAFSGADAPGIEGEYGDVPHVALDLALNTPAGSRFAAAMIVPLSDLGGLLGIETGAEQMADADFANAQMQVVAGAMREYFDLLGMTLFKGQLAGIEVVPVDARLDDIATTVALIQEAAAGSELIRVDLGLTLPGGEPAGVLLLAPQAFLDVVGASLAGAGTGATAPASQSATPSAPQPTPQPAPQPTPLPTANVAPVRDASPPSDPFGLDADPDNVSPFRPAGTFGAPARDDVEVHPVRFPPLSEPPHLSSERRALDLIMDVSMRVTVELGRASLTVEDVLGLGPGSVVELNKLAGEPVDVMVNDQLIARGEVVVVDENFGVRVTEIVSPRRRAQAMGA